MCGFFFLPQSLLSCWPLRLAGEPVPGSRAPTVLLAKTCGGKDQRWGRCGVCVWPCQGGGAATTAGEQGRAPPGRPCPAVPLALPLAVLSSMFRKQQRLPVSSSTYPGERRHKFSVFPCAAAVYRDGKRQDHKVSYCLHKRIRTLS